MSHHLPQNSGGPEADKSAYGRCCDIPVTVASVVVGVDPGLSGALAFYDTVTGDFHVLDMPTRWITRNGKRRRQIDCVKLGTLLDTYTAGRDVRAYVEQVGAMPGQGVTSMFSFGRACGVIDGGLGAMGVDPVYVIPRTWQKAVQLDKGAGKGIARQRAAAMWPAHAAQFARNKDDGRADASLILVYGLQQQETCK